MGARPRCVVQTARAVPVPAADVGRARGPDVMCKPRRCGACFLSMMCIRKAMLLTCGSAAGTINVVAVSTFVPLAVIAIWRTRSKGRNFATNVAYAGAGEGTTDISASQQYWAVTGLVSTPGHVQCRPQLAPPATRRRVRSLRVAQPSRRQPQHWQTPSNDVVPQAMMRIDISQQKLGPWRSLDRTGSETWLPFRS